MTTETPSQDCPRCGRFVQDRPNYGLHCECGWKNLRGSGGRMVEPRRAAEGYPFPSDRDPDEWHRKCRDRLFAHHPGPPARLTWGGYGLEPGDRLTWRRKVWTVARVDRWPEANGHTLDLETADGARQRVTVPWNFAGWARDPAERVEVLTSAHHPACGHCGQPWPCREVDERFEARRAVDALLRSVERETEFPVECPADPPCSDRFKTERGAAQHLARSRRHRKAV